MSDNLYDCGNCGYSGPCYGTPVGGIVSAPWCPKCQRNNKLKKMKRLHIEQLSPYDEFCHGYHFGLVDKDADPSIVLYTHFCSSVGFALGDLIGNDPTRIKELQEKYGVFYVDDNSGQGVWLPPKTTTQ